MELGRAEVGLEQVEVEGLTEPGGTGVERPPLIAGEALRHRSAGRGVLVEHLAPLGQESLLLRCQCVDAHANGVELHCSHLIVYLPGE